MNYLSKLSLLFVVFGLTLAYSLYEKKKFDDFRVVDQKLILQTLPDVNFVDIYSNEPVTNTTLLSDRGLLVHFWGTWCAPCEAELPEFLDLAKRLEPQGVKVLLLAVNDDNKKIKKFLKRFKNIPSNVVVVHDEKGKSMADFGTFKVPETFLFHKSGKHLNKFIGPQDWKLDAYMTRIINYLSKVSAVETKVETH